MTTDWSQAGIEESARRFQPYAAELQDDPYPFFGALRSGCPVARSEAMGGFWILSRYEDVRFALQRHDLFSNLVNVIPPGQMTSFGPDIPTQLDPPEHTAYRKILIPLLGPRAMALLEDDIRRAARRLLEPICQRGSCDFLAEFAVPLPTQTFCALMGLPVSDLPTFLAWKDDVLRAEGPEQAGAAKAALGGLIEFFTGVYRERSAAGDPGSDLMGQIMAARPGGTALMSESEFVRIASFLWAAGLDTVTAQLSFAVLYLGRHPGQRDRLVADPALIPAAIEELMRYDTLVNDCRQVREDLELGGRQLRAGNIVMLSYSAAGRDPEQFPDPDVVDFDREPNRHLGFGAGVHRCARLAPRAHPAAGRPGGDSPGDAGLPGRRDHPAARPPGLDPRG